MKKSIIFMILSIMLLGIILSGCEKNIAGKSYATAPTASYSCYNSAGQLFQCKAGQYCINGVCQTQGTISPFYCYDANKKIAMCTPSQLCVNGACVNSGSVSVSVTAMVGISGDVQDIVDGCLVTPQLIIKNSAGEVLSTTNLQLGLGYQKIDKTFSNQKSSDTLYFIFNGDCCLGWDGKSCTWGGTDLWINSLSINGVSYINSLRALYNNGNSFAFSYNIQPACTPITCSVLGKQCDSFSDGCGGTLNCGTCSLGYVCSDGACVSLKTQCNDGIDNDGDGAIDFPKDTGCSSANDISEFRDSDAILSLNSNIVLLNTGDFIPGLGINPQVPGSFSVTQIDSNPLKAGVYNTITYTDYCQNNVLIEFYDSPPSDWVHEKCFSCSGGCLDNGNGGYGVGKCSEVICPYGV